MAGGEGEGESRAGSARALSFGPAAQLYERVRPGYPPAVVAWLLGAEPVRVADLGAGTGKFSRALAAAAGHRVVAIEPDPLMAAQLRAAAGSWAARVAAVVGRAEAIPLASGSVGAAVAAQSYHWFDQAAAHPEIARVVRPGGVFGAVWNLRDEAVPWVAELTRLIGPEDVFRPHRPSLAGFGPVEEATFRHSTTLDADGLVALVATRSYYLTASPARRAELERGLRELARTLPPAFELPYVTVAYRAVREGRPAAGNPLGAAT